MTSGKNISLYETRPPGVGQKLVWSDPVPSSEKKRQKLTLFKVFFIVLHRGIFNKKLEKVTIFQVLVAWRFFE